MGHAMHERARYLRSLCLAGLLITVAPAGAHAQGPPAPVSPPDAKAESRTCAKSCHRDILDRKVMHGPAQQDCGVCHVQGNPAEHKFYLVADKQQLCRKCHALEHRADTHKPVAEGKCLECHDPHGSSHPRLLVADPKRDLCARCHAKDWAKAAYVHGPVAAGACVVCHEPHSSDQPNLLVRDAKGLCLTCHGEIKTESAEGLHVHGAIEQGCTKCHSPHASEHRYQLLETAPNLCLKCHKDKMDQMLAGAKVIHGALKDEGGCSVCHEPHSSRQPALQRSTQPGVCLECHNKPIPIGEQQPLTNMAALLAENPVHHGPIREGACTACHNPHGGERYRMLVEDYPPEFYAPFKIETFSLCFKCHIPDLVLKPSGRGLTRFRNGDRNLHWVHVNQEKGRTCRACHEVHASKRPAHIREAVPFGANGWMLEINYQQTERGGSCSPGCHKTRSYDTGESKPQPAKPQPKGDRS